MRGVQDLLLKSTVKRSAALLPQVVGAQGALGPGNKRDVAVGLAHVLLGLWVFSVATLKPSATQP